MNREGLTKGLGWIGDSERLREYYVASHRERLEYGEIWINGEIDKAFVETAIMRAVTIGFSGGFSRLNVFLNSSGGCVDEAFGFVDVLLHLPIPVWTINISEAASMGFSVYLAGERRFALEHSNFMAHSISYSKEYDKLKEQNSFIEYVKKKQVQQAEYYARRTKKKQGVKYWTDKFDQADCYFDAREAKRLGIVTDIVSTKEEFNAIFEGVRIENGKTANGK
jgi:ATP-dependent Clp protease, protease subunit